MSNQLGQRLRAWWGMKVALRPRDFEYISNLRRRSLLPLSCPKNPQKFTKISEFRQLFRCPIWNIVELDRLRCGISTPVCPSHDKNELCQFALVSLWTNLMSFDKESHKSASTRPSFPRFVFHLARESHFVKDSSWFSSFMKMKVFLWRTSAPPLRAHYHCLIFAVPEVIILQGIGRVSILVQLNFAFVILVDGWTYQQYGDLFSPSLSLGKIWRRLGLMFWGLHEVCDSEQCFFSELARMRNTSGRTRDA